MNMSDIKQLSDEDVTKHISENQHALMMMRFDKSKNELKNPSSMKKARKTIARLFTFKNMNKAGVS